MQSTTQYIIISLFTLVGTSSCSKEKNVQRSTPNIHTDFNATNGADVEKKVSVSEIMVQFRGCKAHQ